MSTILHITMPAKARTGPPSQQQLPSAHMSIHRILLAIFVICIPYSATTYTTATQAQSVAVDSEKQTSTTANTSQKLKVMTWNLEWFYDENRNDNFSDLAKEKSSPNREAWDWRRDAIAKSIAAARPNIAAFQEVENRRVLWYLSRALQRNHQLSYFETGIEGRDFFTEQDVGYLNSAGVEVEKQTFYGFPPSLRDTDRYHSVTKHLETTITISSGGTTYPVIIFNTHLRAREEAAEIRVKQARLIRHWIAAYLNEGADVIVLGDINTEHRGNSTSDPNTEIGVLCGAETNSVADDLIDLTRMLATSDRGTHLLAGKEFDRILCSRSLMHDDPDRLDLVFSKIENLRDLCIQGDVDTPEQHWEQYWEMAADQRDLSDHLPIMATFELK